MLRLLLDAKSPNALIENSMGTTYRFHVVKGMNKALSPGQWGEGF
jgi:hypothetical protein